MPNKGRRRGSRRCARRCKPAFTGDLEEVEVPTAQGRQLKDRKSTSIFSLRRCFGRDYHKWLHLPERTTDAHSIP